MATVLVGDGEACERSPGLDVQAGQTLGHAASTAEGREVERRYVDRLYRCWARASPPLFRV